MRRRIFATGLLAALIVCPAVTAAQAPGVLLLDDSPEAEARRVALEQLFDGERTVSRQDSPVGADVGERDASARQRAGHADMLAAVWLTESTVRVVLPRAPGTAHATLRPDAEPDLFARLAGALIDQFLRHAEREPVRIIGVQGFLDELDGEHPVTRIQGLDAFLETPPGEVDAHVEPAPAPASVQDDPPAAATDSTFALDQPPPEPDWGDAGFASAAVADAPPGADTNAFRHARDTGFVGVGVLGALHSAPSGDVYGGAGVRGRLGYLFGEHLRLGASASLVTLAAMDRAHPFFSTCAEISVSLPVEHYALSAGLNGCVAAGLLPEVDDRREAAFGSGSLMLAVSGGLARRLSLWGIVELGVAGGGQLSDARFSGTAAIELRVE